MKKNLGNTDRVIRFLVAVFLGIAIFSEMITGVWAIILGIVGIVLLATSLIGFCPLYAPFKVHTTKKAA